MAARKPAKRTVDQLPPHLRRKFSHERCTDFDELLDLALADGQVHELDCWPDGTPLLSSEDADQLRKKIYALKPVRKTHSVMCVGGEKPFKGIIERPDGTFVFRFKVFPKDVGRANIAERAERGEQLPYNRAADRQAGFKSLKEPLQALAEGKPASQIIIPSGGPAPAGHCPVCGKPVPKRDQAAGRKIHIGCETSVEILKLKRAEADADAKRQARAPVKAPARQPTPAERLAALFSR